MSDIDALKITSQLISAFHNVKAAVEKAEETHSYCDIEYNDLTHALELISFNASDGYRLAKELKNNRLNRRNAKDQKEQLQPLFELMNRHKNFFNELKNVQAMIERTKHVQQSRTYTPRARTDLFENKGANKQ